MEEEKKETPPINNMTLLIGVAAVVGIAFLLFGGKKEEKEIDAPIIPKKGRRPVKKWTKMKWLKN